MLTWLRASSGTVEYLGQVVMEAPSRDLHPTREVHEPRVLIGGFVH